MAYKTILFGTDDTLFDFKARETYKLPYDETIWQYYLNCNANLWQSVYVLEKIGYQKPMPTYFECVAQHIPAFDPSSTQLIWDNLYSDMVGGIQVGMNVCYSEQFERNYDVQVSYEIARL